MRPLAAAALCLALAAGESISRAAEKTPLDEVLERYRALRESVLAEVMSTQQVCRSLLAEGLAHGHWTPTEARSEEERIFMIFEEPIVVYVGWPNTKDISEATREPRPPGPLQVIVRATKPVDASATTAPVALWLEARMRCLKRLYDEAEISFARAAVERAEEIWLAAENKSDLYTARRILTEALSRYGGPYSMARDKRRMAANDLPASFSPRGDAINMVSADLFDVLGLMNSSQPILFVEPETNPGTFATNRILWAALRKIHHRSLEQPAVIARIAALEARFAAARRAADAALDAAILRNAPAAEFLPLFNRAMAFRSARVPVSIGPAPPDFPNPVPLESLDYLRWIEPLISKVRIQIGQPFSTLSGELVDSPPPLAPAYRQWLLWRKAEEENRPDEISRARQTLRNSLQGFPSAIANSVASRLPKPAPAADPRPAPFVLPPRGNDAEQDLLAALQAVQDANRDGHGLMDPSQLIDAWTKLADSPAPVARELQPLDHVWTQILSNPRLLPLLEWRDAAARKVLAASLPQASPATPVATLLGQAFEKACVAGDLERATRILALDAAGAFLPAHERMRAREELSLLTTARDFAAGRQPAQALSAYAQLLSITTSQDLAAEVARRMKPIVR